MTQNTEFDLIAIGTLAKTLIGAGLPESLVQTNVKGMFKGFDVKRISEAVAAYEAKIARDDQLAKVARLSYDDKMKLAKGDAEYQSLFNVAIGHLVEFRNARKVLFKYASTHYALELKWQTENEEPSPVRAQRAEGSNANGGAEKGGITYANGTYVGNVGDVTTFMIVDHSLPEDSSYSAVTLLSEGGYAFGIPSPRVASDYLNDLHPDSAGQLSAKEFWTLADDTTTTLISKVDRKLQALPQSYLDWAKVDTRKVVQTHVDKYSIK
jgi:hypothetical protein